MAKHAHAASPVLRTVTTRLITALLVALAILAPTLARPRQAYAASTVAFTIKGKVDYAESYKFLTKLNKLRKSKGVGQLTMDTRLLKLATQRGAECAISYSHTRPDDNGWYTVLDDYTKYYLGENIAYGYPELDAATVYTMWKNSSGHYQNMINGKYRACGVCCFKRDGVTYWVNLFSSARTSTAKKPANVTKKFKVRVAKSYLTSSRIRVEVPDVRVGKSAVPKVYFYAPTSQADCAVPLPSKYFTFKVKSTSVVKVATNGKLTGKKAGKTKLSATLKAKTSCKASTTVIVTQ